MNVTVLFDFGDFGAGVMALTSTSGTSTNRGVISVGGPAELLRSNSVDSVGGASELLRSTGTASVGDVIGIIESSTSCSSSVITTGDDDSGVFGGGVGVVASGDPDLATVLHAGLPSVGRAFDNVALLLSPIAGASWWFGGEAELARGTSDCRGRWTTMDSSVKKVGQFILCAGVKT